MDMKGKLLIMALSIIISNKLTDKMRYKFNTSWELDSDSIPNTLKYHNTSCGYYWIRYYVQLQNKLIIEYPDDSTDNE